MSKEGRMALELKGETSAEKFARTTWYSVKVGEREFTAKKEENYNLGYVEWKIYEDEQEVSDKLHDAVLDVLKDKLRENDD